MAFSVTECEKFIDMVSDSKFITLKDLLLVKYQHFSEKAIKLILSV